MNAYELADHLEKANYVGASKAANMLRQQADRIAELEKPHKYDPETGEPLIDGYPLFSGLPRPQTKPLSDEEIDEILESLDVYIDTHAGVKLFARAIEERHGIK